MFPLGAGVNVDQSRESGDGECNQAEMGLESSFSLIQLSINEFLKVPERGIWKKQLCSRGKEGNNTRN